MDRLGEDDLAHLSQRQLQAIFAGYVVVVDGSVWNGYRAGPFASDDLPFPTDSLNFCALLLEDLVAQVGQSRSFLCAMAEVVSLRVEVIGDNSVAISTESVEGPSIAPPTAVRLDELLRELASATEDGLAFGARVLDAQAGSPLDREASRQFLERWRMASEGLKRTLAELLAGPA